MQRGGRGGSGGDVGTKSLHIAPWGEKWRGEKLGVGSEGKGGKQGCGGIRNCCYTHAYIVCTWYMGKWLQQSRRREQNEKGVVFLLQMGTPPDQTPLA